MGSGGDGEFWFSAVNFYICDILEFCVKIFNDDSNDNGDDEDYI